MMLRVPIILANPYQEQNFLIGDDHIRVTLRYNSVGGHWAIDVYDLNKQKWVCQGISLCLGVPILWRDPCDYFFMLDDTSGTRLDALGTNDLGLRLLLYVGLKADYETMES